MCVINHLDFLSIGLGCVPLLNPFFALLAINLKLLSLPVPMPFLFLTFYPHPSSISAFKSITEA